MEVLVIVTDRHLAISHSISYYCHYHHIIIIIIALTWVLHKADLKQGVKGKCFTGDHRDPGESHR